VVEDERPRPVAGIEDDGPAGIVGAARLARRPGHEDRRDRVEARVARGVRVGAQLAEELDRARGLFAGLAAGGRLERLAVLDEAAGQGPAAGRVPPLDEDDARPAAAAPDLDDDIDGRDGIAVFGAGHRRCGFHPNCKRFPGGKPRRLSPDPRRPSPFEDGRRGGPPARQAGLLARIVLL
jgi:hypothetical protein